MRADGHILPRTRASDDLKRCARCGEEKPPEEFSRDRSRKDGRAPWCKAGVRRWQHENAEHLADYHRRWQQANPERKRAQDRRYRERKRQDPDYRARRRANARRRDRERRAQDPDYLERRRANNRRYRERKRARLSDAPTPRHETPDTAALLPLCHPSRVARSNPKTAADERFEAYLSEHGIPFKYEPDWAQEFGIEVEDNPDYLVDPDGSRVICEVKQFETTRITERLLRSPGQAGWISHKEEFGPIRSKVTQTAQEQLSAFKGLGVPLVVVLANPLNADVHLDFDRVAHALLGNPKVRILHRPGMPPDSPATPIAEDYGAFISIQKDGIVNHHPFVSAVVAVHQWPRRRVVSEDSYRWVHVYDVSGNPTPPGFSGTPLPRHIFNGPRDRWWGFTGETFGEITTVD